MPPAAKAEERAVTGPDLRVASSAEAAARNLADHFRYGFVTGHRLENLTERQLSDFLCGRTSGLPGRSQSFQYCDQTYHPHLKSKADASVKAWGQARAINSSNLKRLLISSYQLKT